MNAVIEVGFDYASLDEICRDDVRDAAMRIRFRMARTAADIIDIGRDLIAVKSALGHGHFLRWIEAEFSLSVSTAQNFMNVADRMGDKFPTVGNLSASVLYLLAAPSTPDEIVEEVAERVAEGETVTATDIKALKDKWREEKRALKAAIDEAKLKAREAQSSQNDIGRQLQEAHSERASLIEERSTLRSEIERLRNGAVGSVKTVLPKDDAEVREKQVSALVSAWNNASAEARQEFLDRIDTPVMDRRFA